MRKSHSKETTESHTVSRRSFLQSSAVAAGAAVLGAPAILHGASPNEKLNVAVIGAGGRGGSNMGAVAATENIVALCDVNETNLNAAAAKHPKARKFVDFRKLYDHANEFDAVVVSTCEHTHAFATLPALQLGKHVYCEKPLTHGTWEARVIREAANKTKVATQMGTQIHAGDNYRRGWQSEEESKKAKDIVFVQDRPETADPIPANLNWDLWLGPAPERPFNNVYFPGPKWYRWWDFGNGTMSDLGSHWIDLPFWALKLDHPLTIEASGPPPHSEIAPASMTAKYEYGARGDLPPVKLTWYQGFDKPKLWEEKAIPQWGSGALFIGDKGMVLADYGKHTLLPEDDFKDFKRPDPFIPKSLGHHAEWIHACKTGDPTTCNFEYAGRLTEANHLGNVAYRVGKKLEWDAENLQVTNTPEAPPLIKREYSKGWKLV